MSCIGQPEVFRLLLCCSAGTPYESFAHDMVEQATDRMMDFLRDCKAQGYPAREMQRDEMHMLISGYCAALTNPSSMDMTRQMPNAI